MYIIRNDNNYFVIYKAIFMHISDYNSNNRQAAFTPINISQQC